MDAASGGKGVVDRSPLARKIIIPLYFVLTQLSAIEPALVSVNRAPTQQLQDAHRTTPLLSFSVVLAVVGTHPLEGKIGADNSPRQLLIHPSYLHTHLQHSSPQPYRIPIG